MKIVNEKEFDVDEIWYVVDGRQSLHFEQVFRASDKSNLVPENVVFIDDREDNIAAAKQFGINGIVFTDYETARAQPETILAN